MIPQWTLTSRLPAGDPLVWTGRCEDLFRGGLDEWQCGRVELYRRLDVAPALFVVDTLSFPWDALRPQDLDIPLVAVLPPGLDERTMPLVLGDPALQHVTPHDRLVEPRPEVRQALESTYGFPTSVWLDGDTRDLSAVRRVLQSHARRGLVELSTDIGTFVLPQHDLITEQLRDFGAHQRGDLNALVSILVSDDVVIDIGAHVGTFAIPIGRRLSDAGRVIALEAHPDTYRLLDHNIEANGLRNCMEAHHVLLGASASVPRSPVLQEGNTGGTWFQPTSSSDTGAMTPASLDLWLENREDAIAPTMLKVDVEGAELDVLQGSERTVSMYRPLLMVEISQDQLERNDVSIRHLDEWFTRHEYDLLVSAGRRNTDQGTYKLEPLESLVGYGERVFDVIAVPRESDRRPEALRG